MAIAHNAVLSLLKALTTRLEPNFSNYYSFPVSRDVRSSQFELSPCVQSKVPPPSAIFYARLLIFEQRSLAKKILLLGNVCYQKT